MTPAVWNWPTFRLAAVLWGPAAFLRQPHPDLAVLAKKLQAMEVFERSDPDGMDPICRIAYQQYRAEFYAIAERGAN